MFEEMSVVTKCFQAEIYSALRASGVSVKPAGKKSGIALGMQVHQFPTANGNWYFQGRCGKKEDLPITYVLQYQCYNNVKCVSRRDMDWAQQHNLDSKKTGTNRVRGRMAKFVR
jgi:hypothetical protein